MSNVNFKKPSALILLTLLFAVCVFTVQKITKAAEVFCPWCTGTISGFAFDDDNSNGCLNPGEGRLDGVVVRIAGGPGSNPINQTDRTGPNGEFSFINLPAGPGIGYTLTVDSYPDGFLGVSGWDDNASCPELTTQSWISVALPAGGTVERQVGLDSNPDPWFQTENGDIHSNNLLSQTIPPDKFFMNGDPSSEGVLTAQNGISIGGGKISLRNPNNWKDGAYGTITSPTYETLWQDYKNKLTSDEISWPNPVPAGIVRIKSDLTGSNGLNSKKWGYISGNPTVIFVGDEDASGNLIRRDVRITDNLTGKKVVLIVSGNITIDKQVDRIEGVFIVDGQITTGPASPPTPLNCWGMDGRCDAGCNASSLNSNTVYQNCNRNPCITGGCWANGGKCDSECNRSSTIPQAVYTDCTANSCVTGECWGIDGKCDSNCKVASASPQAVYTGCGTSYCPTGWIRCDDSKPTGQVGYGLTAYYPQRNCQGTPGYGLYFNGCKQMPGACYEVYGSPMTINPISSIRMKWNEEEGWRVCTPVGGNVTAMSSYQPLCWVTEQRAKRFVRSPTSAYSASGSCSNNGSGSCYKVGTLRTYYLEGTNLCERLWPRCKEANYYDSAQLCTWTTLYSNSYSVAGSTTKYSGSGSCSGNGSGSCYKLTDRNSYYTGGGACGSSGCSSDTYYSNYQQCTWTSLFGNSYSVSGSTTKYSGSGSCSNDGSGNCYKLTSGSTYYTGGGACGSSDCSSGTYFSDSQTCKWYSSVTGIKQLYLSGIFIAHGGFILTRDLGEDNKTNPAEKFVFNPSYLLDFVDLLGKPNYTWQEVAP